MKSLSRLMFLEVLMLCVVFGQGTIKVTTDKSIYLPGEPIQVRVSVSNNSDSTFSIWGSTSAIAQIRFNTVYSFLVVTYDEREFRFAPGTTRTWIWNLVQSRHGIPDREGTQTIRGMVKAMVDSVKIQAPRYYGGRLIAGVKLGVTALAMQSLRDSIGATVLSSDTLTSVGTISERWQITGHTIDSIAHEYKVDYRLKWIEIDRIFDLDSVVVSTDVGIEQQRINFALEQNYPNPFNPSTTIRFSIPKRSQASLKVTDLLGRHVATLLNSEIEAGTHATTFDGSKLAGGVYFYRLQSGSLVQTRKLVIMK